MMGKLAETLRDYREAAVAHADPNPKKANESHDRVHACYKILRETEEGQRGIIALTTDENPYVRCWAAAHSLQWAPDTARQVLEKLRDSGGPWALSFDAEMILKEFDKGRLSFDY